MATISTHQKKKDTDFLVVFITFFFFKEMVGKKYLLLG